MSRRLKLGKRPARPGAVQFKLRSVLRADKLPARPRIFGHQAAVPAWGMLANDRFGCCVWAGAAHETMLTNAAAGRAVPAFRDADVLTDYAAVTGFEPAKPDSDQGTDMELAAQYRRKTGVRDALGVRHKIKAYLAASDGDVEQALNAAYFLGGLGIGFLFPDYAMDQFDRGEPWDLVENAKAPEEGHYVNLVGFDGTHLLVVTWGRVQRMSLPFYRKLNDESQAFIYPELIGTTGLTPEGFDMAALDRMLAQVTGGASPAPVPVPVPTPSPPPTPENPVTLDPQQVQRLLIGLKFDVGKGGPTGLGDDGDWGPHSQIALDGACKKYPVAIPAPPTPGPTVDPRKDPSIAHIEAGSAVHQATIPPASLVAFVWHHTGGHLGGQGTLNVVNQRGLSVNYALDRTGKLWQLADWLEISYHAGVADKAPWNKLLGGAAANYHTIGCEVDASLDSDVLPVQIERAKQLAIALHPLFPNLLHIGHGELSSQKMANEGLTIARAIRISDTDCRIKPALVMRAAA